MATTSVEPVKLLAAVLFQRKEDYSALVPELEETFSSIDFEGKACPFVETDYYEAEMGSDLQRMIISFEELVMPDCLAATKHAARRLEDSRRRQGNRIVNIDVGYLDIFKLVLASFKGRSNKLYLGDDVWADLVLYFEKGNFQSFLWSFPDFKSGIYHEDLMTIRNRYKSQLKKLPANKVKSAKIVGQDGIEAVYNRHLIGTDGGKQVEVNNTGKEIKTFPNQIDPIPGNDVILSIDSDLQKKVEEIMRDKKGAAVVMNPHNGEILAMVSQPAFDPNEFSQGLSYDRWQELQKDPDHILNNKCIQGGYSPGSTFKMVVAAAALETGLIKPETEIMCEGRFRLNRTWMHCWKRSGHGKLNVVQAIENSCNVFFYKIAMELGIDKIKEYANRFGLGEKSGIDLLNESSGLVPDRKWKLKRFKKEWLKGETPNIAIGQGYISVTPIQLVSYINIIANGGTFVTPRIVKQMVNNNLENGEGSTGGLQFLETDIKKHIADIKPETLKILRQGMEANVLGENGTGARAKSRLVNIAGKTGTTQVISFKTREKIKKETGGLDEKYFNHSWFVCFAPAERPMISAVVMIEHGEAGKYSAQLSKKIIEYYFTNIASIPEPPVDSSSDTYPISGNPV